MTARLGPALRQVALTLAALLGTLCLLAGVAHLAAGVTPLIVTSGSMEPAIDTGSLILTRDVPASEIDPGDIVTVRDDALRVTHRVVATEAVDDDTVALTLQGDANDTPDPVPYLVDEAGTTLLEIPDAGYVASWLFRPGGWLILGSLVLAGYALRPHPTSSATA